MDEATFMRQCLNHLSRGRHVAAPFPLIQEEIDRLPGWEEQGLKDAMQSVGSFLAGEEAFLSTSYRLAMAGLLYRWRHGIGGFAWMRP